MNSPTSTADLRRLMALLMPNARTVVEVGPSDGRLASLYKTSYPACFFQNIAPVPGPVDIGHAFDIEQASPDQLARFALADGWVFDQTLEKLRDPVAVLMAIRGVIAADAALVVCLNNGRHWAWEGRANGLLDRETALAVFHVAGFRVTQGVALSASEEPTVAALAAVRAAALRSGRDPDLAAQDALPRRLLLRAERA